MRHWEILCINREGGSRGYMVRWQTFILHPWTSFNIETYHKPLVPLLSTKEFGQFAYMCSPFPIATAVWLQHPAHSLKVSVQYGHCIENSNHRSEVASVTGRSGVVHWECYRLPTSPNQFEVYKKAQASDAVCPNRENHLLNNLNWIKSLPDLKLKVMKPPKRLYSQLRGGMW